MLGTKTFTVSLWLALAGAALAQHPNYFPLEVGNQWIYAPGGRAAGAAQTVETTRAVEAGGKWYAEYRGLEGTQMLRMDESGALYAWDPQSRTEARIGSFLDDSAVFEPRPNPCGQTGRIASRNAKYSGPLGESTQALEIRYSPGSCRDAGLESELYLPYIGLVRRTTTTIAGPRVYDLIYARIGGVTVVSAPEVSFSLSLKNNRLGPTDTLIAQLTLRNTQPEPLKLSFSSGQMFDLAIKNEKGERVYAWSADKAFIMVFIDLEVAGEKNFIVEAPLPRLSPGRYTVEAWLTNTGTRDFTASAPMEVR